MCSVGLPGDAPSPKPHVETQTSGEGETGWLNPKALNPEVQPHRCCSAVACSTALQMAPAPSSPKNPELPGVMGCVVIMALMHCRGALQGFCPAELQPQRRMPWWWEQCLANGVGCMGCSSLPASHCPQETVTRFLSPLGAKGRTEATGCVCFPPVHISALALSALGSFHEFLAGKSKGKSSSRQHTLGCTAASPGWLPFAAPCPYQLPPAHLLQAPGTACAASKQLLLQLPCPQHPALHRDFAPASLQPHACFVQHTHSSACSS